MMLCYRDVMVFLITIENQYTESEGNDNYAHQTLGRDKTNTIIIIVGSVFGGIIVLLLPAIVILPLLLTCCRIRSLRVKPQK